jgi:hypothetical protein
MHLLTPGVLLFALAYSCLLVPALVWVWYRVLSHSLAPVPVLRFICLCLPSPSLIHTVRTCVCTHSLALVCAHLYVPAFVLIHLCLCLFIRAWICLHPRLPHLSVAAVALVCLCHPCLYMTCARPPSCWPASALCLASACGTSL